MPDIGELPQRTVAPMRRSDVGRRLASYLAAHPDAAARYARVRNEVTPLRPTQYDIAKICNLKCEGCLYFTVEDHLAHELAEDPVAIDAFFRNEAERGVNFCQFSGAEPSLNQETLRIAARHLRRGVVFTNGTVRISDDVPYKLHISVWGLDDAAVRLRGADVVDKAIKNYRGDPRALFVYTINAENVEAIPDVVAYFAKAGVPICFNHFSPTELYDKWLAAGEPENDYFRVGVEGAKMAHTPATMARSHALIAAAMKTHPDTALYSRAFSDWVHAGRPMYEIDPVSGVALDCPSRVTKHYRHYRTDLTNAGAVKCCAPNVICKSCRLYEQSLAAALARLDWFAASDEGISDWLEMWDFWCAMHIPGWPRA